LFLRLPDDLDPAAADRAREDARPSGLAVDRVQLVTFTEGRCVQLTHHGHYADEPASLALLDEYMTEQGLERAGLHHEIYLSDVRESDPAKMHTILRQPVRPI
ncbi:GyrI-like domain-containing protein, partial [Streptomyces sp. 2MCAF27]